MIEMSLALEPRVVTPFIHGNKENRIVKKGFHIFHPLNFRKSFGLTPENDLGLRKKGLTIIALVCYKKGCVSTHWIGILFT